VTANRLVAQSTNGQANEPYRPTWYTGLHNRSIHNVHIRC